MSNFGTFGSKSGNLLIHGQLRLSEPCNDVCACHNSEKNSNARIFQINTFTKYFFKHALGPHGLTKIEATVYALTERGKCPGY